MKEYIQVKGKGIKVSLNELIYSSYVCIVCEQALYFECSGEASKRRFRVPLACDFSR